MQNKYLAIDTETTGLYIKHGCRAFMVTAASNDGDLYCWHFRINPLTRNPIYDVQQRDEMFAVLNSYDSWVFHNSTFDLTVLSHIDKRFTKTYYAKKDIHDTMIMAHTHRSNGRLGLKPLAMFHLSFPEDDEKRLHSAVNAARRYGRKLKWAIAEPSHKHLTPLKKDKSFCDYWLPYEVVTRRPDLVKPEDHEFFRSACRTYAIADVERTVGLAIFYHKILSDRGDWGHYDKHRQVILPTLCIQDRGFPIRADKLPKAIAALKRERIKLIEEMRDIVGDPTFNPASGPQVAKFLYVDNQIDPPKFTKSEAPSTDGESLNSILETSDIPPEVMTFISHKITLSKFSKAESAMESYMRFSIDGRLFGNLKIPGTKTLRYSMKDPNAQNVSKLDDSKLIHTEYDSALTINLRNIFGPPPGYIWFAIDYTQLQLRIFAKCCNDPYMMEQFRNNADAHDMVARKMFNINPSESPTSLQRRAAKGINFGIIFGAGPRKIESMTGQPGSYAEYKKQFPLVDPYIKKRAKEARANGFIRTVGGYPLQVERKLGYKACNIEVQGTEGELVKQAVIKCERYLADQPFHIVMLIHDEFILESKKPMTAREANTPKIRKMLKDTQRLMNDAAGELGIITTTDCKMTTTTWADAE